jgi:phage I-like protein
MNMDTTIEDFLAQNIEVTDDDDRTPAPPELAKIFGLEEASVGDILRALIGLQDEIRAGTDQQQIEQEIASAVAVDAATKTSKLLASEIKWAEAFGREHGLRVLQRFLKLRPPILPAVRQVHERLAAMKSEKANAPLSDVQQAINRQFGISDETFRKYIH